MNNRKQKGLTLVGFAIVLTLVIFFIYVGMRTVPSYLEYHALVNAMDQLEEDPSAAKLSAVAIKQRLINSLWVSYSADNIKREHIRITRSKGIKVRVAYEVRKPLLGNVDLLLSFDRTVTLR